MSSPASRLRIAVLNRVFSPTGGGAERYSIALVEQLASRHEIHVFAQKIDHYWPGVTYHQVSMPLTRPRWINQLWYATATWWATRKGFDVVHSHENTWHGQVQTMHVMPVKHNVFHGHTGFSRVLRWLKVLTSLRLLVYLLFERARLSGKSKRRCVVASSDSLRQIITATYPQSAHLLKVVSPGIRLIELGGLVDKQAARSALGLPATGVCILFVGHDYRKKGLEVLISAMCEIPVDTVLAVVGSPTQVAVFRNLASSSGVASRVFFLGALKDVSQAYIAADILAHPTLEDTFAMVVLEAMAHGLAVVVSSERYCGISALLNEGTNALILNNPKDKKELSKLLNDLVSDTSLRQRLGNAAIAFARLYQWPVIASQQEAIYYSVCNAVESVDPAAGSSCRPRA